VQSNHVSNTPRSYRRISPRDPLGGLSGNAGNSSGFAGYGMSAGLKVSNLSGAGTGGFIRPAARSRGEHLKDDVFLG